MFGKDFAYLFVPPLKAKKIEHPTDYIKKGEKQDAVRRIFKSVNFDKFESKSILELEAQLAKKDVKINTQAQSRDVLLRFLYQNSFNIPKTIEELARHILWLREPRSFQMDENVLNLFQQGVIYLAGRDLKYRPTLVVNVDKINPDTMSHNLLSQALSCMCVLMEDYMFFQQKVENWNLIVDTAERCLVDFPSIHIEHILKRMQENFPCTVEKIFIISPSLSLMLSWNMIESLLGKETQKKIEFVKTREFTKFKKYYDPFQLEQKFGGKMEDIKKFWPPVNTIPEGSQYEPETLPERLSVQKLEGEPPEPPEKQEVEREPSVVPEFNPYLPVSDYDQQLYPQNYMEAVDKPTLPNYQRSQMIASQRQQSQRGNQGFGLNSGVTFNNNQQIPYQLNQQNSQQFNSGNFNQNGVGGQNSGNFNQNGVGGLNSGNFNQNGVGGQNSGNFNQNGFGGQSAFQPQQSMQQRNPQPTIQSMAFGNPTYTQGNPTTGGWNQNWNQQTYRATQQQILNSQISPPTQNTENIPDPEANYKTCSIF